MNWFISFVIGMIFGSAVTYLTLQKTQRQKIAKLERILSRYERERQVTQPACEESIDFETLKSNALTENKIENIILDSTEIQDFLISKGIQIKTVPSEQEGDESLNKIAIFMGNRYSRIRKFYDKLKSSMNSGNSFTISLRNDTQEQISNICQLAHNLYEIAFLEEYKYQKSPKFILYARPSRMPKCLNFLSGQWLERFVKEQVIQLVQSINPQLRYSYLLNPQIILPNGNDFELDVIFKIEEDIFWFEAKTGEYQRYVEKYSKMSSILNLDKEHSYMILTDVSENSTKALSSLFKMTVVNIEEFAEQLKQSLDKYASISTSDEQ